MKAAVNKTAWSNSKLVVTCGVIGSYVAGLECLFNYKPYNGKATDIVECFSDSLEKCE